MSVGGELGIGKPPAAGAMTLAKDDSILAVLERPKLATRGWRVVDHWDADRRAIGIAAEGYPRRLVYVSTFGLAPADGVGADAYGVVAAGDAVELDVLERAIEAHLGQPRRD